MSETRWAESEDPAELLGCLRGRASDLALSRFAWETLGRIHPQGRGFTATRGRAFDLIDHGAVPPGQLVWAVLGTGSAAAVTPESSAVAQPDAHQAAVLASEAMIRYAATEARNQAGLSGSVELTPFDRFRLATLREGEGREQAALLRE